MCCAFPQAAVWLRYGECLQQLGRLREATSAYERTCELAPGHAQARLALCQLLLAQGLTDRAIACLESADTPQQGAMGDADVSVFHKPYQGHDMPIIPVATRVR